MTGSGTGDLNLVAVRQPLDPEPNDLLALGGAPEAVAMTAVGRCGRRWRWVAGTWDLSLTITRGRIDAQVGGLSRR